MAISVDGKGAWRDNIFVERFWRSIKYEEVYLHAYDSVAKAGISRYIDFYNPTPPFVAGQADPGRVLLRDAAGDPTGSMSGEHELPTASVVRSSQATPARRHGQLFTDVRPAGLHLSKPVRCSDNRSHLCSGNLPSAACLHCHVQSGLLPLLAAPALDNDVHVQIIGAISPLGIEIDIVTVRNRIRSFKL